MLKLKFKKIGASFVLILPKKMLERLHAKEGQPIVAIETPTGYALTYLKPSTLKQVETGEEFLDRYKDVFSALAK